MAYTPVHTYAFEETLTSANLNNSLADVASYAESLVGSGPGSGVSLSPSAAQTIQPTTVNVAPLALRAHASSAAGTSALQIKAGDGINRFTIAQEGGATAFTAAPSFRAFANTTDSQPVLALYNADIRYGAGGSSTPDLQAKRGVHTDTDSTPVPAFQLNNLVSAATGIYFSLPAGRIVITAPSGPSALASANNATPLDANLNITNSYTGTDYNTIGAATIYTNTQKGGTQLMARGIRSTTNFGTTTGTVASGTGHCFSAFCTINAATFGSEHCCYFGFLRYDSNTGAQGGRAWFTDWVVHGQINAQQSLISGVNLVMNNRYNGSPQASPSYAYAAMTAAGSGAGWTGGNTYSMDVGFWVGGQSTSSPNGHGWEVAFKVGHGTHPRNDAAALTNAFGWNYGASTVRKGMQIDGYTAYGIHVNDRVGNAAQAIRTELAAGPAYFRGGLAMPASTGTMPTASQYAPMSSGLLHLFDDALTPRTIRLCVNTNDGWYYVNLTKAP